jgi:hypothetical protein
MFELEQGHLALAGAACGARPGGAAIAVETAIGQRHCRSNTPCRRISLRSKNDRFDPAGDRELAREFSQIGNSVSHP